MTGYSISSNYKSTIVKWRVLEEEIHDETAVDACINSVSCADYLFKRVFVRNDNQSSCLFFGHSATCFSQVVHSLGVLQCGRCGLAENPVDDGAALVAVHIPVSEPDEELSDLRLEDHDECKHSDIQNHIHYGCHQSHVECGHEHSDHIKRDDRHEDAHGRRASDPAEQEKYNEAQQQDIENVCDRQLQKAEKCEYHIPYIILVAQR